jgi:hypothetical protein
LQARRITAFQKGVGALLKIDFLFPHPNRQPVMLVEADPCGKREVGTHADEHAAPMRIVHVEVELVHPALFVLQMGAFVALVSDGHQHAGRFPRFQDRHYLIGFGILEIRFHELVAPALVTVALRRFENRSTPFLGSALQPVLNLVGDVRQGLPGHPLPFAAGIEETEHALWLLEWLDQTVEQKPVKTPGPFMNVAEGSVEECRYFLILVKDLRYGETEKLSAMLEEVSRLLGAYAAAILASGS